MKTASSIISPKSALTLQIKAIVILQEFSWLHMYCSLSAKLYAKFENEIGLC